MTMKRRGPENPAVAGRSGHWLESIPDLLRLGIKVRRSGSAKCRRVGLDGFAFGVPLVPARPRVQQDDAIVLRPATNEGVFYKGAHSNDLTSTIKHDRTTR